MKAGKAWDFRKGGRADRERGREREGGDRRRQADREGFNQLCRVEGDKKSEKRGWEGVRGRGRKPAI